MEDESQPENFNQYNIAIGGSYSSGKTAFVRALHEENIPIRNKQIIRSIYDYGHIEVDDYLISMIALGGSLRFDYFWELVAVGLLGFIIVVDSCKPESFRDARSITGMFSAYAPVPYVIAANKQDSPYAWSADDIRIALHIPHEIPVIPCSTHDKKSVANVLIALCEEIIKDIDAHNDV